jgi:hypothetical protein
VLPFRSILNGRVFFVWPLDPELSQVMVKVKEAAYRSGRESHEVWSARRQSSSVFPSSLENYRPSGNTGRAKTTE